MEEYNEIISIREFARRVEVDESTVRKYINNYWFTNGVVKDEKGRNKLAWPLSKEEWDEFGGGLNSPNANDPEDVEARRAIAEYKKRGAYFRALSDELEYKEKADQLVSIDEVNAALSRLQVKLREEIYSSTEGVVDKLRAAPTRAEAHQILTTALTGALSKFTNNHSPQN